MTQQMSGPPAGPFCQSCSMPLVDPSSFGTEADGTKSSEYCSYCYADGAFVSDVTMEEMVTISAKGMSEAMGTPEAEARELIASLLPGLKRWQAAS